MKHIVIGNRNEYWEEEVWNNLNVSNSNRLKPYYVCYTYEDTCDHDYYCHTCPYDYITEDEEGLYYHHCKLKERI